MKPRKNYRSRPKKRGAKRKQRVRAQERRLVAAGYDKEKLDKMTTVEIRELLKVAAKKKDPAKAKKKIVKKPAAAKKPAAKKTVKAKKPAAKKTVKKK